MPVLSGYWKQHELTDGTYTYMDWLDITEAIQVQRENQFRDYEAGRNQDV